MCQRNHVRWRAASCAALSFWLGCTWGVPRWVGAAEDIVAPGATIVQLSDGFEFTEGPACDAEGNVLFTDQPNDRILKWSVDGKLSTFKQPSGRSNGLCFDSDGNLWACADEKNELWSIRPDGSVEVVVKDYEGKLLNAPNDIWLRPDRGIYFTDPFYQRDYWKRGPSEQSVEGVYYLAPDRKNWSASSTTCNNRTGSSARPTERRSMWPTFEPARPTRTTSSRMGHCSTSDSSARWVPMA